METNPSTAKKSDQVSDHQKPSDHHDQLRKGSSSEVEGVNVRSYSCNFCKRAFSNAQALGGHMNVHRKDRAKLISQFLSESEDHNYDQNLDSDQKADDHDQVVRVQDDEEKRKILPVMSTQAGDSSSHKELDLELRLGPHPKP